MIIILLVVLGGIIALIGLGVLLYLAIWKLMNWLHFEDRLPRNK
jgi:hypothetical protein